MRSLAAKLLAQLAALLAILIAGDVRSDPPANGPDSVQSLTDHPQQPEAPPDPAPGDASSALDTATHAPRRANRLVYACREGATPVFSDRPCGQDEQRRRLEVPSPATGDAPNIRPPAPQAATRPIAARTPWHVIPNPPDRCARLEEQLASIDARMRHGYSAREAARLWQRWRDAKARLRAAGC